MYFVVRIDVMVITQLVTTRVVIVIQLVLSCLTSAVWRIYVSTAAVRRDVAVRRCDAAMRRDKMAATRLLNARRFADRRQAI